eukprot:jgi/Mesvir1/18597/Mv17106-RA.1
MGNSASAMKEATAVDAEDRGQLMECLMEGCLDISEGCYDRFKRIKRVMKHPPPEPMDIKKRYLTLRQLFDGTQLEWMVAQTRERVKGRVPVELGIDVDDMFRVQDGLFEEWKDAEMERAARRQATEEYIRNKQLIREESVNRKRRQQEEAKRAAQEEKRRKEMKKLNTHDIRQFFGSQAVDG